MWMNFTFLGDIQHFLLKPHNFTEVQVCDIKNVLKLCITTGLKNLDLQKMWVVYLELVFGRYL